MNNWIWKILFVFSLLLVLLGGHLILLMTSDNDTERVLIVNQSQTNNRSVAPTIPMKSVSSMPYTGRSVTAEPYMRKPMVRSSATLFNHRSSSAVTRTYGGGTYGLAGGSRQTGHVSTTTSAVRPESFVSAPVVYPVNANIALARQYNPRASLSVRKSPGTGGVKTQWETWLDEWEADGHDRNDPTGLEEWWYQNYGDGANPDIFGEFYSYYFSTPLPDGLCVLMILTAIYMLIVEKKRNKRYLRL